MTISLLSGYAGYLPAEALHVSAVLAAVTTGIVLGWKAPEISSASMRLPGSAAWEIVTFLLNGHGRFQARVMQLLLHRLSLTAGKEELARIAFVAPPAWSWYWCESTKNQRLCAAVSR